MDTWRFSAVSSSRLLKPAAGRGGTRTAAPAETTNVLSTRGEKRCATATATVKKPETAAKTTNTCVKYQVSFSFPPK